MQTKRTRHAVYNITYHLVWCPKYRRPVLTDAVSQRLDTLIREQVQALKGDVIALEIQPDHVHLFAEFPPTLAVRQIMHRLKGHTSHELRKDFDWLNSRLPSLWTRSYYVGTVGNVSAETIRRYIEEQTGK
ncbi:MAG: IS200/IS605 family transposase [Planctomycetota bacterium]|jgi:putative transposase